MTQPPEPSPRRIIRRLPDTLPEDADTVTNERGLVALDPNSTEGVVTAGHEGVPVRVPAGRGRHEYPGDLRPVEPERDLDAQSTLQIGCARLLQGMKVFSHDLSARLKNANDLQSRDWKLERIYFDHPRQEDDLAPPSAVIFVPAEGAYDRQGLTTELLEDTLDVFGAGTILRKLGHFTCELDVTIWSGHKEERRGVKAAIERTFLAEPGDPRQGRRVVVREAYDRVARFTFMGSTYPDRPELAQSNQWIISCRIAADIDRVVLVVSPGLMQSPTPALDI